MRNNETQSQHNGYTMRNNETQSEHNGYAMETQ